MAKPKQKHTTREKEPVLEGGEATRQAHERVKIEGKCDGTNTVISQTNDSGNTETINWPKNVGDCGDFLVIRCLDARKQPIRNTDVWISSKKSIKSYKSPPNASSIVFYCPDHKGSKGSCVIEIDRT